MVKINEVIDSHAVNDGGSIDSDVVPNSGEIIFTTKLKAVGCNYWGVHYYGGDQGYGLLDIENATLEDPDSKWVLDILEAAASKNDDPENDLVNPNTNAEVSASDTGILVECKGRYESGKYSGTESYQAPWIKRDKTVWVKASWDIYLSGGNHCIDMQLYISDKENNWKPEFEEFEENHRYTIYELLDECYCDASGSSGTSCTYKYKLDFDGDTYTSYIDEDGSINGNPGEKIIFHSDNSSAWEIGKAIEEIITKNAGASNSGYRDVTVSPSIESIFDDFYHGRSTDIPEAEGGSIHGDGGLGDSKIAGTFTVSGYRTTDSQIYCRNVYATQPAEITLSINKSIKNKNNYSSNFFNLPEYDLTGTKFYLYEADGTQIKLANSNEYAVLTIPNATGGTSNEIKLDASYGNQTIYLEEKLPATATGFKKQYNTPDKRLAITLPAAGKSMVKDIENEPLADPALLSIKKVSNITNGAPIADIDYSGIKYTMSYFGNGTSAKSNAYSNTGVVNGNTWVFETIDQGDYGFIDFANDSQKLSGPDLYKVNGFVQYPVGWYRIQENQDQEHQKSVQKKGLEVSKDIYYVHIFINDANERDFEIYKNNEAVQYQSAIQGTPAIKDSREGGIHEKEHWEPFGFVKRDIHLSSGPEGDAELKDAIFTVYSEKDDRFGSGTEYDGHTYTIRRSDGAVLVDGDELTIEIKENGEGICPYPLPKTDNTSGHRFYIKETTAPYGYKENDIIYYVDFQNRITVEDLDYRNISIPVKNMETGTTSNETSIYSITYDSSTIIVNDDSRTYEDGYAYNTPRKGIIQIEKFDAESDDNKEQGDGSLAGIKFAIVNRSEHTVYYKGKTAAKNCVAYIAETDSDGEAEIADLPFGRYDVYELSRDHNLRVGGSFTEDKAVTSIYANASYLVADNNHLNDELVEIYPTSDDDTEVDLTYQVENYVVRAGIKVIKTDTEMTSVQGDASLANIRYAIVNRSINNRPVIINGTPYNYGDVVAIITTNEDGVATTANDVLPYCTYDIYELRSDATINVGDDYDNSNDLGTSIYANNEGYLYTSSVEVAKSTASTYNMATKTKSPTNGGFTNETIYNIPFNNVVSNGKLTVQKSDDDAVEEQGDSSFNGINFAVVNRSTHAVYYENKRCEPNTIVAVHQTQTVDGKNGIFN